MSKNYTQLSLEQRYQIEAFLKAGLNQKSIALHLGVDAATISRELRRNTPLTGFNAGIYEGFKANKRARTRHQLKPKKVVFTNAMKRLIIQKLTVDKWSPELISRLSKRKDSNFVSHEWIYQWIWQCKCSQAAGDKQYHRLYEHLRHGKRRRKRGHLKDRRGVILNRVPIEQRPAVVKKRERLGDLEVDLMMGKNRKGAVLVMTDRASLHTQMIKLKDKNSKRVKAAILKQLSKSRYKLHTLTFDNDQAFAEHQSIARVLNVCAYFTRPYTSQDKGTVENRIGVIRRFIPKKTDLRFVTAKEVKQIQGKLNNRPIRKFNYLTANQVLTENCTY